VRKIISAQLIPPLVLLITLLCAASVPARDDGDNLRVAPSKLKLVATGVRFEGLPVSRGDIYEDGPKIIINGIAYYASDSRRNGLVAENVKTGTVTIYEAVELALKAGWLKQRPGNDELGNPPRGLVRGYARSVDTIWMGMDTLGILAFDTKRKTWTRYDSQAEALADRVMTAIFYADEEYVFAGGYNVYSRKRKSWIQVDAIPTRYVRSFGYSGWRVQLPWSLTKYAKEKFLPLNEYPNSVALAWPEKVTLRDDNEAYIFELGHDEAYTQFIIEKWQLDWAFSQAELKVASQQAK
jgi:hypothetical protein